MAFEVEQLFKSIDIILQQRLQDVNFDKTIICTIVDDSNKKNGCYVVSDGTIKFNAYVSDATYKKDDQVRVSVLGGDFSEKKFITGRYTGDENSSPITYKSPLESIIPITGNLVESTKDSKNGVNSLRANSEVIEKDIWRIDLTSNSQFRDLQSNGIYNTLTIKADFKTLLSHYDLVSGNYGLRLDLLIQPSFDNPTQRIRKYVTLDSSEMMGNPYSFSVYSTQAKKVDIVSTGVIAEMVLWMYQSINGDGEGRRFIDRTGAEIPVNKTADDILIKNIEIGFGSDVAKVSDNTLQIFSSNPPYYVYQDPTALNNKKDMEMLWFNKTENDEYVGFSDGLYDLAYDEIEYLKKANQDTRLIAQTGRTDIPNDEPGLKLAADLKDAKPLMVKARDALTSDVAEVLQNLQRQVKASEAILTELDKLLDTINGSLVQQYGKANEALQNWDKAYVGALQYAYDKQNKVKEPKAWDTKWNTDYHASYIAAVELGVKKVRDFFIWLDGQTQPSAAQAAYRGDYDLYLYRVEIELALIEDWLDQIDTLLTGNHTKLTAYKNASYTFTEYKQKDFSAYANKYCIYWYRYERGYKLQYQKDKNNDEYNYGKFMTDGWRKVSVIQDANKILYPLPFDVNPDKIVTENGKQYYPIIELKTGVQQSELDKLNETYKAQKEGYFPIVFIPNFGLPRDELSCVNELRKPYYDKDGKPINKNDKKYYAAKALAQVASRMMERNRTEEKYAIVLFNNHEMYKSNILTFTNSEPQLIPNDALLDKRDALKIEHGASSQEHYQIYNEFNLLKSLDDGGKIRHLKCFYDGLFKKDEALINAGLYWYIPNHSTMLTFDKEDLIKEGFSTDADGTTERSIPGYTYFYKKIRKCEDGDMVEDENGEKQYTCRDEDRFFFYKVKPELEKAAKNNTIKVKAYIEGVEQPVEGEITMTFGTFGTNGTKYTLSVVPSTSQTSVGGKTYPLKLSVGLRDSKNEPINIVDVDSMTDNEAYGFSVSSWKGLPNAFTTTTLYDEEKKYVKGLEIKLTDANINSWHKDTPYFGILNAKVSFRIKKDDPNIAKENEEVGRVSDYQKYRVVDLNTLYAITYSSSNAYYMSGATTIVYNNQGTVSYVSEDEYKLYTVNQKGNTPVPNQVWSIEYYSKNGTWINSSHQDWNMLRNYMPVLNSENRLTPAPLYINDLDYVPVVICTVDGSIAWVQPIIITQNRYASSTLNDWNGSLTIDEKNGTILSTAVGAGKKETDNSFSGVLMGDIGRGMNFDSDNMSGLGVYGFNWGDQSFCLSVDGKAFFGKAGRGRIYFDGDKGTISSASYESQRQLNASGTYDHLNNAGMMIDLDDGFIHMLGAKKTNGGGYEPDKIDGKTSQAEVLISTGLFNGSKDAYFKIRSKDQTNAEHYLMYVDTDDYYLQTDDYNGSDKGVLIDLKNGLIDAYKFSITAGNVNDGLIVVKSHPGSDAENNYYLYAGTDQNFIYIDSEGDIGIQADTFKLSAGSGNNYIYISDDPTSITYTKIDGSSATDSNILLKLGTNFGVSNSGVLYATNANITGKINATTIKANDGSIGGWSIGANTLSSTNVTLSSAAGSDKKAINVNGGVFYVLNSGFMYASSGTIGGWSISGSSFTSTDGKATLNSSGSIVGASIYVPNTSAPKFKVDSTGKMTATGADINGKVTADEGEIGGWTIDGDKLYSGLLNLNGGTTSTITATSGTNTFTLSGKDGKITATNAEFTNLRIIGDTYFSSGSTGTGTGGNKIYMYSNTINIGLSKTSSKIWIDGTTSIGAGSPTSIPEGYRLRIGGNCLVDGNLSVTVNGTQHDGFTGSYSVDGTGIFDPVTLSFVNGLLINATNATGEGVVAGVKIPSVAGNSNKYLRVNSSGTNLIWQTAYPPTGQGTSGYVWTSNGSGKDPSWKAIPSQDLSEASVKYATSAGSATSCTNASKVYVNSGGHKGWILSCSAGAGNSSVYGASASSLASAASESSKRFKNTITEIKEESSILYKLKPVSYFYNEGHGWEENSNLHYGFIAEDVDLLDSNLVTKDPDNNALCNGLYYDSILTLAVAEIQKLRKELDELKSNLNIK